MTRQRSNNFKGHEPIQNIPKTHYVLSKKTYFEKPFIRHLLLLQQKLFTRIKTKTVFFWRQVHSSKKTRTWLKHIDSSRSFFYKMYRFNSTHFSLVDEKNWSCYYNSAKLICFVNSNSRNIFSYYLDFFTIQRFFRCLRNLKQMAFWYKNYHKKS